MSTHADWTTRARFLLWIRLPLMAAALGALLVPGWPLAVGLSSVSAALAYILVLAVHVVAHLVSRQDIDARWRRGVVYGSLLLDLAAVVGLALGGTEPLVGVLLVMPLLALALAVLFPSLFGLIPPLVAALVAAAVAVVGGQDALSFGLWAALVGLICGLCGGVGLALDAAGRRALHNLGQRRDRRGKEELAGQRRRLAREIHDTAGATFAGAGLLAGQLSSGPSSELARQLGQLLEQGAADLRQVLHCLRGQLPARQAITDEVEAARLRYGFAVECELGDPAAELDGETTLALLRVVREALVNAARHAQCQTVWVSLSVEGGEARLELADDGVGFDPDEPADGHYGLVGIRERVEELGGTLEVDAAPGRGSRMSLVVPSP